MRDETRELGFRTRPLENVFIILEAVDFKRMKQEMKKIFLFVLFLSLSACTTFAPPRPPCCDDSVEDMRPINPDMISAENLSAWEAGKEKPEAEQVSLVENSNDQEN